MSPRAVNPQFSDRRWRLALSVDPTRRDRAACSATRWSATGGGFYAACRQHVNPRPDIFSGCVPQCLDVHPRIAKMPAKIKGRLPKSLGVSRRVVRRDVCRNAEDGY
jgi:hypothetical protein